MARRYASTSSTWCFLHVPFIDCFFRSTVPGTGTGTHRILLGPLPAAFLITNSGGGAQKLRNDRRKDLVRDTILRTRAAVLWISPFQQKTYKSFTIVGAISSPKSTVQTCLWLSWCCAYWEEACQSAGLSSHATASTLKTEIYLLHDRKDASPSNPVRASTVCKEMIVCMPNKKACMVWREKPDRNWTWKALIPVADCIEKLCLGHTSHNGGAPQDGLILQMVKICDFLNVSFKAVVEHGPFNRHGLQFVRV